MVLQGNFDSKPGFRSSIPTTCNFLLKILGEAFTPLGWDAKVWVFFGFLPLMGLVWN